VAALSNKNESFDFDFAVSLRYKEAGVWNSEDKVKLSGTRLGGFGCLDALSSTLRTVSSEGSIARGGNWTIVTVIMLFFWWEVEG
jgi:hypothetical protein